MEKGSNSDMVEKKLKIKVCIPFHTEFKFCKPGLRELRDCKDIQFDIVARPTSVIAAGRNNLINDSRSCLLYQPLCSGYDYYLMCDSDIRFTLNDIRKLISNKKPVCFVPYKIHDKPHLYDCGIFHPKVHGFIIGRYKVETTGLKQVDWSAAGLSLIEAQVYENTEFPWYRQPVIRYLKSGNISSESIGFCMNLTAHGHEIWCDFDIHVEHKQRTQESYNFNLDEE